jgi:hypothetical protein
MGKTSQGDSWGRKGASRGVNGEGAVGVGESGQVLRRPFQVMGA